jgi:hypothetical protein
MNARVMQGSQASGFPVTKLLQEGRVSMTVLLWIAFFMNLLVMYFLVNWMPSLLKATGLPLNVAILSTAVFNAGGVAWHPCHGLKMRYTNPITGNHAMATMATFIQLLPKDFAAAAYRSTDAMVFVPIEGNGRSVISSRSGEDIVVEWGKRDIFVVPSRHRVRHEAIDGDAVIFSYSDRPIQEVLNLFRKDRSNA